MELSNKRLIILTILIAFLLVISSYPKDLIDVTDLYDYSDAARIFAGDYKAKERSSHSMLYGFLLSPLVKITGNFFIIKFMSLLWLFLLIILIYHISGKNRKSLLLLLVSPLIWYMAPWLSPLPLVYLLFTLAYFFIDKFKIYGKYKYFIYSGLCLGLASALWDPALYFSIIFLFSFFYNKKLYSSLWFASLIIAGMVPKFILDYVFFDFAFYGLIKHLLSTISFSLFKGIYEEYTSTIAATILTLIFIPIYFFFLYKKEVFIKYKSPVIFITLSWLFVILTNAQPRLIFIPLPIALLILGRILGNKQVKIQIVVSLAISFFVITPYLIQITHEINLPFVSEYFIDFRNIKISSEITSDNLRNDLINLGEEYPLETFVVGNAPDDYRKLAHFYWGDNIKEFVSIQDYNLYYNNQSIISSKRFETSPPPNVRRTIWLEAGLGKNQNDKTDYDSISYALSLEGNLTLKNFQFVKKYKSLYLYKKLSQEHI